MDNQKYLLRFPTTDYCYINIDYYIYNNNVVFIDETKQYEQNNFSNDIKTIYFIFKKMNWFISHELKRKSVILDPYWNSRKGNRFSIYLYRKNIIDFSLKAFINEQNKLVVLNEKIKESLNINTIFYAIDLYMDYNNDDNKLFDFDLNKLDRELHKYFQYQYKREEAIKNQKQSLFPTGQEPIVPAPVILESLMTRFPNLTINEILNFDMSLLPLLETIRNQKEITNFERDHMYDEIIKSN